MAKKDLAAELAELNVEQEQETTEAVKAENVEAEENTPEQDQVPELDIAAILAENERLKAQLAEHQEQPKTEGDLGGEDPALYWEGILHPDYRLKTVYVPIAHAPSKMNGYDPDFGESYVYTQVSVMHKPPGQENHRRDVFNVRVDTRSVVPAFVAEQLGERADAQDYWG